MKSQFPLSASFLILIAIAACTSRQVTAPETGGGMKADVSRAEVEVTRPDSLKKGQATVAENDTARAGLPDELAELKYVADSLYWAERFDEALPYWIKVLEQAGGDTMLVCEAHYVLGNIFFQKGDYAKAELELKRSILADSLLIDAHRDLGLLYFVRGNYDAALTSFGKVLQLSPNDSDASYWIDFTRGSAAYENGIKAFGSADYSSAIQEFEIAATYLDADTSANYKIYFYLGKAHIERFEYDDALGALEQCVEFNPNWSDAYVEMAGVYFALQDFEKAIAYNQKALSIHPDSPKALNNLGYVYYTQANTASAQGEAELTEKLYQVALRLFERAAALSPKMAVARNNIEHVKQILAGERTVEALTLMNTASKIDKLKDRISTYEKIIERDSTYDDAYNNLGVTLFYAGETDRAEEMLRRAIALDPYNYQAHNNLGLLLGTIHRYDEALKHLFIAIQIRRDYFDAYYNVGYIYMWKEDFESSRRIWLQLLKINVQDKQARKGLDEMNRREELVKRGESSLKIEVQGDDPAEEGN